jgi:hypothetical protein
VRAEIAQRRPVRGRVELPPGTNAITAVYSGKAGFVAPTSSALSISACKLSTIMFSARRTTQLATMPVVLTGQVNSEWALKVP